MATFSSTPQPIFCSGQRQAEFGLQVFPWLVLPEQLVLPERQVLPDQPVRLVRLEQLGPMGKQY